MTQRGEHTWDLTLHYHSCPQCSKIIESRETYHYQLGSWIKNVHCVHCGKDFTFTKNRQPSLGPLIGPPQPTEFDWDT